MMRMALLILCLLGAPCWAEAQSRSSRFAPQIYLGVQHVEPWRLAFQRPDLAVTGLALWPLPKRASVQVQWIQPMRRGQPALLRCAIDLRIR